MKYHRKPIIVEAEQFFPEVSPWPAGVYGLADNRFYFFDGVGAMWESKTRCEIRVGDWVVTNPSGARYVVSMYDFSDWYERIPEARNG